MSKYWVQRHLGGIESVMIEARDPDEALRIASEDVPESVWAEGRVVFLAPEPLSLGGVSIMDEREPWNAATPVEERGK